MVLCSQDGNLTVWVDITADSGQIVTHRFAGGRVMALAASLSGSLVVIAAALDNHSLHCVSGSVEEGTGGVSLTSHALQPDDAASAQQPSARVRCEACMQWL